MGDPAAEAALLWSRLKGIAVIRHFVGGFEDVVFHTVVILANCISGAGSLALRCTGRLGSCEKRRNEQGEECTGEHGIVFHCGFLLRSCGGSHLKNRGWGTRRTRA